MPFSRREGRSALRGFTLVELMIAVAIVGVLAVLGIYGVRKYLAHAKTAEARNSLGQISKDAVTSYERETMSGAGAQQGQSTALTRAVCDSASASVPSAPDSIKGKRYQSDSSVGKDWGIDAASNKGFACLRFSIELPQYYMYSYSAGGRGTGADSFDARANGDLNGDGSMSTFSIVGKVQNGAMNVAPSIFERNADE